MHLHFDPADTIYALSTPNGVGAIAVIRLSGTKAFEISHHIFKTKKKHENQTYPCVQFGQIEYQNEIVDEAVATYFKGPHSYSGEDTVEFSCHGSPYIRFRLMEILHELGARQAVEGEFTQRAFLNGKMDLSKAEAVADLIHSESKASHQIAIHHLKGGFSNDLKQLREKLIEFASLIELELDFGEEDVQFANRDSLQKLVTEAKEIISDLIYSFKFGNAIKNGITVTIVGAPNAGKSTLLNALLNEDKAIVSDIAGTTRDSIEDTMTIQGVLFRFIDTAGIRNTPENEIEKIGIEKTYSKIKEANIIIYLAESLKEKETISTNHLESEFKKSQELKTEDNAVMFVINKIDNNYPSAIPDFGKNSMAISAKEKFNLKELKDQIFEMSGLYQVNANQTIVTNVRHIESLKNALSSLQRVEMGFKSGVSSDLIALDIRQCLHYLGIITGEISTNDLLASIFSRFCIGK